MTVHLHNLLRNDGVDQAEFDRTIMDLRRLGLPYSVIAKVVGYYESWFVTADQVRARLRALGDPPNEAKSRWMRERARVAS